MPFLFALFFQVMDNYNEAYIFVSFLINQLLPNLLKGYIEECSSR